MKAGKTLQELAIELDRMTDPNVRKDYVAPQAVIEAVVAEFEEEGDDGALKPAEVLLRGLNGGSKAIRPYAHKQLADVLGIPTRYYERMKTEQPELLATNINTWLRREPEAKRMIRTIDDEVRAVLSPKYRALDNYELAQAVLPKLIEVGAVVMSSELTETRMYIKAILPSLSDELPPGMTWGNGHNPVAEYDGNAAGKVVAALTISNSEVGNGSLRVEPSAFTTWCTNLAVMKSAAMKKYHVGRSIGETENFEVFRDETRQADDRAFFLKVRDVVAAAFDEKVFAAAIAQIRTAATEKIAGELPAVVEKAVEVLALPPKSENAILNYLAQGGDFSKWGLASAVSATANGLASYEDATQFERASGEVLALGVRDWNAISTARAAA